MTTHHTIFKNSSQSNGYHPRNTQITKTFTIDRKLSYRLCLLNLNMVNSKFHII